MPMPQGISTVTPAQKAIRLIAKLAEMDPKLNPQELLRGGHLVSTNCDVTQEVLADKKSIENLWREISLRLQAASDQHAAVTMELQALATTDPQQFTPTQVWTLVKTIKVLSQLLNLYTKS